MEVIFFLFFINIFSTFSIQLMGKKSEKKGQKLLLLVYNIDEIWNKYVNAQYLLETWLDPLYQQNQLRVIFSSL